MQVCGNVHLTHRFQLQDRIERLPPMTRPKFIPACPVGLSAGWHPYPQTKRDILWG